MKKNLKLLMIFAFSVFLISCSTTGSKFVESFVGEKVFGFTERELFLNKLKEYKLEAIIKTTKGDMKVYLYPEAAPTLVANFVFLAMNDYYDNIDFHRVNVNNIIQAGDRSANHDGTGTPCQHRRSCKTRRSPSNSTKDFFWRGHSTLTAERDTRSKQC